jgi:thiamine-phosphate pyrophosphorylase
MSPTTRQSTTGRRERLARARLYFVVEAEPGGEAPDALLEAALAGGVDIVQLREKSALDRVVLRAGATFRRLCDAYGALLIVNDRPDLALAVGADGVHVGQEDPAVEDVRAQLGDDLLIGFSTHSPAQFDAGLDSAADYLSVGPVYETPTKPGRPAVGEELIAYAAKATAARRGKPFFAIGGIDPANAAAVVAAGAERIAVVRAIRDAHDPRGAAAALRAAIERGVNVGAA